MDGSGLHPAVARVLRDAPGDLLGHLADDVSAPDLTTLLLEVHRRRAARLAPPQVLAQYERDRFVRPGLVDAIRLAELELAVLRAVAPPFEPVVAAPLAPLGTHSVIAGVSQNRVVTTARGTEVAGDLTNMLALEAAARRRRMLSASGGDADVVDLAAVDRVVRAQTFDKPLSTSHFSLLGLVTAGRDPGGRRFERDALQTHVDAGVAVVRAAGYDGVVVIRVTDFSDRLGGVVDDVMAAVAAPGVEVTRWPGRPAGRGYYPHICFKVAVVVGGEEVEVGDGGFVGWTAALVGSAREQTMISGASVERLASLSG